MKRRLSIYAGLLLSTFLVVVLSAGCKSSKKNDDSPPPTNELPDSKLKNPPIPIEVENLTATVTSANEVLLTWNTPKEVTSELFKVALCRGHEHVEDCSEDELEIFDAFKNSYELTNLGPGTLNSFKITIFSCPNSDGCVSRGRWTSAILPTWEDKDFQFWCNFPNKSRGLALTVEAILKSMVASNCLEALTEIPGGHISLNDLSYSRDGIFPVDLVPLAYFPDITDLSIDFSQIENLEPLRKLVNLKSLSLAGNLVKDVEPILGLASLESLDLSMNDHLKDLSHISNLTNLKELRLHHLSLSYEPDFSGLSQLENLTIDGLTIYDNVSSEQEIKVSFVTHLKWLKGLSNLTVLSAQNSLWGWDLTGIEYVSTLETLELDESPLANRDQLKYLPKLTHLDMNKTGTADLGFISNLNAKLNSLELGSNEISNLAPLQNLSHLSEIDLSNNKIIDVSPLVKNKELRYINLENNLVEDASSLLPLEQEDHTLDLDIILIGNPIVRTGVCPFNNKEICHFSKKIDRKMLK